MASILTSATKTLVVHNDFGHLGFTRLHSEPSEQHALHLQGLAVSPSLTMDTNFSDGFSAIPLLNTHLHLTSS
jgi:hypothetical protein